MAKSKKRKGTKPSAAPVQKKDKLTWKYWIIGTLVVAAVTGLIILGAVLASRADVITFTEEEGGIIRDYDGTMYKKAPATYRVRQILGNEYGKMGDTTLYKVGFYNDYGALLTMDDDNYLTDKNGTLYYGEFAVIPELVSFRTDEVNICTENLKVSFVTLTNTNTPDATDFVSEYLAKRVYSFEENGGLPQETYTVLISSSVYSHLYYVMHLVTCDNGDVYVYTDEDPTAIKVSAEPFSALFPSDTEDTVSE